MNRVLQVLLVALIAFSLSGAVLAQDQRASTVRTEFSYDEVAQPEANPSASDALPPAANAVSTAAPTHDDSDEVRLTHEFRMSQQRDKLRFAILLAVTALIAHIVVLWFLPRSDKRSTHFVGTSVVSATGLIYIVFGTIILVVIATTEAQLTAAMGILGAVAGYLFGRMRRDEGAEEPAENSTARPGTTTD